MNEMRELTVDEMTRIEGGAIPALALLSGVFYGLSYAAYAAAVSLSYLFFPVVIIVI